MCAECFGPGPASMTFIAKLIMGSLRSSREEAFLWISSLYLFCTSDSKHTYKHTYICMYLKLYWNTSATTWSWVVQCSFPETELRFHKVLMGLGIIFSWCLLIPGTSSACGIKIDLEGGGHRCFSLSWALITPQIIIRLNNFCIFFITLQSIFTYVSFVLQSS